MYHLELTSVGLLRETFWNFSALWDKRWQHISMRVVKVTPFLRWEGGERGEKIGREIERQKRSGWEEGREGCGCGGSGGGDTPLFAFHLLRALTSAWIRHCVCSHRSVLLFGGGGHGRSCTSCTVKVSKCRQIMIFRCNFTCVLKPAVILNSWWPNACRWCTDKTNSLGMFGSVGVCALYPPRWWFSACKCILPKGANQFKA